MEQADRRIELYWHPYRYFPYERALAAWEAETLLAPARLTERPFGVEAVGSFDSQLLDRLVYFGTYATGSRADDTLQRRLERSCSVLGGKRKQATRYGVHGLHDYRGKFNPQIVRGILNALGIGPGVRVLDPFCGSGTSLVECAIASVEAVGVDLNPLAIFLSNAKRLALTTPAEQLAGTFAEVFDAYASGDGLGGGGEVSEERGVYLQEWFDPATLDEVERLRAWTLRLSGPLAPVVLALASDLLRDYSLQEPADLRIRRRRTPMPKEPLRDALHRKADYFLANVRAAQAVTGTLSIGGHARLGDSRRLGEVLEGKPPFDAALTSPPYATALPYIDTQRLSLVWLGLCAPAALRNLEAELTGSREFAKRERRMWAERLNANADRLPHDVHALCREMQDAVGKRDGFRRQAKPALLYRYLVGMRDVLRSVRLHLKVDAPFALVVGHNRTTLGGRVFDLDTPDLLRRIATSCGWAHDVSFPLQTYHRYSVHSQNAVRAETLLVVRNGDGV